MVRLEVRDEADEVKSAYNFTPGPGAQISVSGFHGTQVYPITEFDTNLVVRYVGISDIEEAKKDLDVEPQTTEDGVTESAAEARNRAIAEDAAAHNDAAAAKSQEKNEKPKQAEPAKASATAEKKQ